MNRITREILGEPGYCHWSIKEIIMLVDSDRYQSKNSTDFFWRWKELHVISRWQRQHSFVRVNRRTAVELFAFQAFQLVDVGLRDTLDRARLVKSNTIQLAPYQLIK